MPDGHRILYVDDEPDLLAIGKLFLEDTGEFSVDTLISAKEALNSADLLSYDAIISDYQMPIMDGISFLKVVRDHYGSLPFVLFTGRGREAVVIEAINNGADFYLQKGGEPVAQFAELAHKLRQAISRRTAEEDLRRAYERIAASEEELRAQFDELAKTEQQVRESEIKYRTLVEVNRDIVYSFDSDGVILYMSPQTVKQIGYTSEEMMGKHFTEFIHPGDVEKLIVNVAENKNLGTHFSSDQFRVLSKDGSFRWYEDNTIYTMDHQGVPVFIGTLRDITERKNAEDAIFESRQMLRLVLDTIPQRVFWKDTSLTFLGCNKQLANDVGYADPSEMIGKTDYDHSSAAIAEQFRQDDRNVMETGVPKINFEEPQIRPDGSTAWLRTSKVPLKSREGTIIGVLGTYEDITDEKNALLILQESEERYRNLADSLPMIVFETGLDLVVTYANRYARETFSLTQDDLIQGVNILSFLESSQHGQLYERLKKMAREVILEPMEYTGIRRDGTRFPVLITSSPIFRNNVLAGYRGIVIDISAWKKIVANRCGSNT